MIQKNMLMILLALLTFQKINTKVCGLVEIFRDQKEISKKNVIEDEIDLQTLTNGKEISVFGWFRLQEINQQSYLLMQLQTYQKNNNNQIKEQQDLLFLSYNNINQNKSYFEIVYAKYENKLEKIEYDLQLQKNQWIFIAYTVNYSKNKQKLYFDTYDIKSVTNKILNSEVDYPSFYLRQFLKFDIGCFQQNQILSQGQTQCMQGYIKNLNMILQYFDNPQYLLYMNYHKKQFSEYIFDFKQSQEQLQQILPVNGLQKPLMVQGDLQFQDNFFVVKGTTQFFLLNAIELVESNEVESPSIFMTFSYQEPLNDQFMLLKLNQRYNKGIQLVFYLIKQQNKPGRYIQLKIPIFNIDFISRKQFNENNLNHLKISLVQEFEQFWVIINDVSLEKQVIKGVHDFDMQLFENKKKYEGNFKIIQLTLLDSASGFFNQYLSQDQKQQCQMQCDIFGNLNYDSMQCLKCDQYSVLNTNQSRCENYCEMGKKNEGGICVNCQDQKCSELQQKFFDITKQGDQFTIKILDNFDRFNFKDNKNFFNIIIQGLKKQDYQATTRIPSEDPSGKTIILDLIILNPQYKNQDFLITFELKQDEVFYSTEKNQIPIQVVEFNRLSQNQNPKNEWFQQQVIAKSNKNLFQNVKPQRQFTETDFENENNFDSKSKEIFKMPLLFQIPDIQNSNQLKEQASSTSTNNIPFINLTTEQIQNKYNASYPLSEQKVEEKQLEKKTQNQDLEHHKKHKDNKSVLSTNDVINRDVAKFLFTLFIIAICFGILGQFFKYKENDFLFQKYIQMLLVFQYLAFLALYDTSLPETIRSFLGPLISNLLSVQRIFDNPLKEKNSQNHNFNLDYQTFTHKKFKEHEISQHFIINSGLIFIIHACIFVLLIIVSILYKCKKKKRNNIEPNMFISSLKMIKNVIANKFLTTMFLVFIIEITIFTLYNFEHNGFHHPTFQFSLFLAFVYFLLTIFCLMHITCHPRYPRLDDRNQQINYPKGYEFIYQGLVNKGCGKYFQGLQYLHYFIFSLVVIISHNKPKVQVVFHFMILFVFSLYVVINQPAKNEFWQFEQSFHQIILCLIFLFFMIVVLDSNSNRISILGKDIFGDFVSYLMTVILTWNSAIVIFCSLRNFYYKTCGKKRDAYDSVGSLPRSMEMKQNKPKKEKLKNTIILERSNEDDSQLIDVDEEDKRGRLNQTSL